MKNLFLTILLLIGLFVSGQKSFFQKINNNDTLTLKVQRFGCIAVDANNYYIIKIIKVDSCYKLNYQFKAKEISKKNRFF